MTRSLLTLSAEERAVLGLRAAVGDMYRQDKIWSRYSNDKVDVAGALARVLRTLNKTLPLEQPMTALSIGSSNEPQFRILESARRGRLFLLDIEQAALKVVDERIRRQNTGHVTTIHGDYREMLCDADSTQTFREQRLGGRRLNLITLHHSLYYSPQAFWHGLYTNLYEQLLEPEQESGPSGAIHAVLMASRSDDPTSTTGLYNHFAKKFFGCHNNQDLHAFSAELAGLAGAQVLAKSSRIEFFVADFERFMAVVWMILLHPSVDQFSKEQQLEVIAQVYDNL